MPARAEPELIAGWMARRAILGSALLFIAILASLTVYVAATSGISVLTPVALLVLALFATGVVGALRRPPPDG